jgi:hypothetical protein
MLNLTLLLPLLARADEVIEMNAGKADSGENVRVEGHYHGRSC